MPIHERYTYDASTSDVEYSYNPTNHLDVSRLLRNKAPWQEVDEARVKKKKTLIVYVRDAKDWDVHQRTIFLYAVLIWIQAFMGLALT